MFVDEPTRVALADLDDGSRRIGCGNKLGEGLGRLGNRLGLKSFKSAQEFALRGLCLGGHRLPERTITLGLFGLGLDLIKRLGRVLMRSAELGQLDAQHVQFGLEFGPFVRRRHRRLEGAGLECWVFECPMEPDAELPSEPQPEQCGSVIPRQTMVGIVARLAHLGEQTSHFARNDALILQAPKQVDLLLVRRSEKTDA